MNKLILFGFLLTAGMIACGELPISAYNHHDLLGLWKSEEVAVVRDAIKVTIKAEIQSGCELSKKKKSSFEFVNLNPKYSCDRYFSSLTQTLKEVCELSDSTGYFLRKKLEPIPVTSVERMSTYISLAADYKLLANSEIIPKPDAAELQSTFDRSNTGGVWRVVEETLWGPSTSYLTYEADKLRKIQQSLTDGKTVGDAKLFQEMYKLIGINGTEIDCDGKCLADLGVPFRCDYSDHNNGSLLTLVLRVPRISSTEKILSLQQFKVISKEDVCCDSYGSASRKGIATAFHVGEGEIYLEGMDCSGSSVIRTLSCMPTYNGPSTIIFNERNESCIVETSLNPKQKEQPFVYVEVEKNVVPNCLTFRSLAEKISLDCSQDYQQPPLQFAYDEIKNGRTYIYCPGGKEFFQWEEYDCPNAVFSIPTSELQTISRWISRFHLKKSQNFGPNPKELLWRTKTLENQIQSLRDCYCETASLYFTTTVGGICLSFFLFFVIIATALAHGREYFSRRQASSDISSEA